MIVKDQDLIDAADHLSSLIWAKYPNAVCYFDKENLDYSISKTGGCLAPLLISNYDMQPDDAKAISMLDRAQIGILIKQSKINVKNQEIAQLQEDIRLAGGGA